MSVLELVLYIVMIIASIALVWLSVNLIKTVKVNRDKKVEAIENKMNKNLTAVGLLTIAVAVLFFIYIIIIK